MWSCRTPESTATCGVGHFPTGAPVVGADKRTGSIAVGKEADMVLVDGDVSKDLGALRRVVTVVSDGTVMDADELRKAAGYSGKPR